MSARDEVDNWTALLSGQLADFMRRTSGPLPAVQLAHLFIPADGVAALVRPPDGYGWITDGRLYGVDLYPWTLADVRYFRTRAEESVRALRTFVRTVRPGSRTPDAWEWLVRLCPDGGELLTECEHILAMFAREYADRPDYRQEWMTW